jgi:hypothetical protein
MVNIGPIAAFSVRFVLDQIIEIRGKKLATQIGMSNAAPKNVSSPASSQRKAGSVARVSDSLARKMSEGK